MGQRSERFMAYLCVNIDHIATVRQARRIAEPDPVAAAFICELAGARGITVHLREDRRHIQDRDVRILRDTVKTPLNLEMAATAEMVRIASELKPEQVTLVPERRAEVTTEGGLDVAGQFEAIKRAVHELMEAGIKTSLFVDPDLTQVEAAARSGAPIIELHTGAYAHAFAAHHDAEAAGCLRRLEGAAARAQAQYELLVNAGHGLNYRNVQPVAAIAGMRELNIGHAIVGHALFVGLDRAVREMIELIASAK